MFRGDLQRDGHTAGATLTARRAASLHPVWTATLGGAIDGTPVVVGQTVIVGTESGTLAAFDLRNGKQAWSTGGLGKITASPAVAQGVAVIGSTNGHVYGLRVSDGRRIWDWTAPGDQPAVWSSPAISGDVVVIGVASPYGDSPPAQGSVAALELKTGKQIWGFRGDGAGVWSSVAIDAGGRGFVGVGNPDDGVMAINVATGQVLWSVSLHPDAGRDLDVGATPVIGSIAGREVVGVGSDGGVFELLDAATGAPLWMRFVVPGSAVHGLIASPAFDGTVLYVPSASPPVGMNALDPSTGEYRWQQLTDLPIYSAPAVGAGVVVFGTGDPFGDPRAGRMIALSTSDGSVAWSYDMKSSVFSAPAISGDEVLVGDTQGALTVFGPD